MNAHLKRHKHTPFAHIFWTQAYETLHSVLSAPSVSVVLPLHDAFAIQ